MTAELREIFGASRVIFTMYQHTNKTPDSRRRKTDFSSKVYNVYYTLNKITHGTQKRFRSLVIIFQAMQISCEVDDATTTIKSNSTISITTRQRNWKKLRSQPSGINPIGQTNWSSADFDRLERVDSTSKCPKITIPRWKVLDLCLMDFFLHVACKDLGIHRDAHKYELGNYNPPERGRSGLSSFWMSPTLLMKWPCCLLGHLWLEIEINSIGQNRGTGDFPVVVNTAYAWGIQKAIKT